VKNISNTSSRLPILYSTRNQNPDTRIRLIDFEINNAVLIEKEGGWFSQSFTKDLKIKSHQI
jgi:hypothetical protein